LPNENKAARPVGAPKNHMSGMQARFCIEYLVDCNATKAAIRAGYSTRNAGARGSLLLQYPHVRDGIQAEMKRRLNRLRMTSDSVLEQLSAEVTADMLDILHDDGSIKPVKEWPKVWRQGLISSIESHEVTDAEGNSSGSVQRVRFSDRVKRMELIGKHIDIKAWDRTVNVEATVQHTISTILSSIDGQSTDLPDERPPINVTPEVMPP